MLVIDDDELPRRGVRDALDAWGALVTVVGAAEAEATALAADVIVCDVATIEAAGPSFLGRLRARHTRGHHVPAIALVSAPPAFAPGLRAAGFERVLTKPVDGDELRAAVRDVVGR